MKRGIVHCEGQTEETFVNNILYDHFLSRGIDLSPTLAVTNQGKGAKGGIVSYGKVESQLKRYLKGGGVDFVTTMYDFYGLEGKDFLGWDTLPSGSCYDKVAHLEQKLSEAIGYRHFLPNFMLHEFEAMLFVDPERIVKEVSGTKPKVIQELDDIKNDYNSPEEINLAAPPSKRIIKLIPRYNKVAHGILIAVEIGLDRIRAECPPLRSVVNEVRSIGIEGMHNRLYIPDLRLPYRSTNLATAVTTTPNAVARFDDFAL